MESQPFAEAMERLINPEEREHLQMVLASLGFYLADITPPTPNENCELGYD